MFYSTVAGVGDSPCVAEWHNVLATTILIRWNEIIYVSSWLIVLYSCDVAGVSWWYCALQVLFYRKTDILVLKCIAEGSSCQRCCSRRWRFSSSVSHANSSSQILRYCPVAVRVDAVTSCYGLKTVRNTTSASLSWAQSRAFCSVARVNSEPISARSRTQSWDLAQACWCSKGRWSWRVSHVSLCRSILTAGCEAGGWYDSPLESQSGWMGSWTHGYSIRVESSHHHHEAVWYSVRWGRYFGQRVLVSYCTRTANQPLPILITSITQLSMSFANFWSDIPPALNTRIQCRVLVLLKKTIWYSWTVGSRVSAMELMLFNRVVILCFRYRDVATHSSCKQYLSETGKTSKRSKIGKLQVKTPIRIHVINKSF